MKVMQSLLWIWLHVLRSHIPSHSYGVTYIFTKGENLWIEVWGHKW